MATRTGRPRTGPLADRLSAALVGCGTVETLARTVFDTVLGEQSFDFACLATTDPASGLITRTYKSHPLPIGDEVFVAAEYGAPDINQFADLARRAVPVGVLSIDTNGEPHRCRRFREFVTPRFAFIDELRLVCGHPTTWGLIALYRKQGEPPFTRDDARVLAGAAESIARGLRRTLFVDATAAPTDVRLPAVLIIDAADRVTDSTAAAEALIEELGGWDHGSLPASVLVVAAAARTRRSATQARVPGRSGMWLRVRAVTLDGPTTNRSVVLTFDAADQAAVGEMAIAARGLTAREQEVVGLILRGASMKDVVAALHLSPHTVQDHLKAIFDKLGVSSRRELIAQFVLA